MSGMRGRLEERLQRKIEQRKKKAKENYNNLPTSQGYIEDSYASSRSSKTRDHLKEWMKGLQMQLEDQNTSYNPATGNMDFDAYGEQDEKELDDVRTRIYEQEKEIDRCKYRMLEITKEMQIVEYEKSENSESYQKQMEELQKTCKQQLDSLKDHYEGKIDNYLQQIDKLLQEKGEFNQQCQIFIQEDNKMNKIIKDLEERYKKDIKNAREAFLVLEKEKRQKWEHGRISAMKEEATLRLQPKLQSIIKDSNEEIKKANGEWEQKVSDFKRQYTSQLNKKLQDMKQKTFKESEEEKEALRAQERKKLKESYERLQKEFEEDRIKMRRIYKEQIIELEKKRREEVDEFLQMNKASHEEHLGKVRKMRDDYEGKVKQMKENVRERTEEQLNKVDRKFKRKLQEAEKEIMEQNQQKFLKAKAKIDESIKNREKEAMLKITNEKESLQRDVEIKYEKKLDKARKQHEEQKAKLKQKINSLEERLITEEKAQLADHSKTSQFHKDYLKMEQKNEELRVKIQEKQNQINRIRQSISDTNMKYENEIRQFQNQKRREYENVDRAIGKKRQEKQKIQQEWIQKYSQLDDENLERVKSIKDEVDEAIGQEEKIIKKLNAEMKQLKQRNEQIEAELENTRKNMRKM